MSWDAYAANEALRLAVLDPPQVRITIKGLNALHAALGGSAPLDLDHAPTALEPVAQ